MTRDLRQVIITQREVKECAKASSSSVYSMVSVAACLLLCVGIVVYALIGA